MKIAVVGSRDFIKESAVEAFIDQILMMEYKNFPCNPYHDLTNNDIIIVSGGARGVDKYAETFANRNGIKTKIFEANWNRYGKRAGFLRNELIINEADKVIAFWDGKSKGTKHSIDLAIKANKPLDIYIR